MTEQDEARLAELKTAYPKWGEWKLNSVCPHISRAKIRGWLERTGAKKNVRQKLTKFTKVVKLCDWHVPHHDEDALNCAINFCKETQPDIIIIDEIHDFYDLSRFDKDPSRRQGTQEEIDIATKYMRKLRKFCPEARIILLASNHLDRLRRFLWKEGAALSDLRCLQLENLLELQKNDVEYKEHFLYKGVMFKHGDLVRKHSAYTAKGEFEKEGCAGASGHTHRLGIHFTTKRGGSYCWVEGGCLCQLNPEYINGVPDWQHGITQFTFEEDGTQYFPQAIPIIHGKIIHDNRVITCKQ